jgi:hypothetical protein
MKTDFVYFIVDTNICGTKESGMFECPNTHIYDWSLRYQYPPNTHIYDWSLRYQYPPNTHIYDWSLRYQLKTMMKYLFLIPPVRNLVYLPSSLIYKRIVKHLMFCLVTSSTTA